MLMRHPKEFERVAREWAVAHAGAPRKHFGESSGGATDESIRRNAQLSKEEEAREELAA